MHVFACFVCFYCCCCGVGDGRFIWNPQAAIKQFPQAVFAPVHAHHAFICLKTYTFCVFCPNFLTKRLKTGRLSITNGSFPSKTRHFQIQNFWKQRSIVLVWTAKMQLPDNWRTSQSLQSPLVYHGCHWSMCVRNRQQKGPKKSLGTQNIFRLPFVISWCGRRSIH